MVPLGRRAGRTRHACCSAMLTGFIAVALAGAATAEIRVDPPTPTAADRIRITASGGYANPCFEIASSHTVAGNRVVISVAITPLNVICIQVLGSWTVTADIGSLAPGEYVVEVVVSAPGCSWCGDQPGRLAGFRVAPGTAEEEPEPVPEFASGCLSDCNGDGIVSIGELIRSVQVALGHPRATCMNGGGGFGLSAIESLTFGVRNALDGCVAVHDFSSVDTFELSRHPALGFCPPIGELFSAALQRQGATFLLSTSVLEEGTPGVDPCLEGFIDFEGGVTCAVPRPQPCRLLSDEETDRVRAMFSSVTLYNGPDAVCLDVIADPCVIDVLRWDGLTATDHVHGARRYDFDQFDQITALLESLAAGPVVPCPASAGAQR